MINNTLILDIAAQPATQLEPLVYEKEVIYPDTFTKQDPVTGEIQQRFTVTENDIDHWVRVDGLQREAGLDVQMPVGHTEDPLSTAAEVLSLYKKQDHKGRQGLFAKFKFKTEALAASLKDTKVSLFSPAEYHHNGKVFPRPIRHIAFTNNPVVPDLGPTVIAASADSSIPKGSDEMKISELALQLGVKHGEDLTDDGIAKAIITHVTELNDKLSKATKPVDPPAGDVKASVDSALQKQVSELTKTNRKMRIDGLLASTKVDAAQAKTLVDTWCGDTLSLSAESSTAFESMISILEKNQPLSLSGERTGGQGGTKQTVKKSPLVRQAEEKAARK